MVNFTATSTDDCLNPFVDRVILTQLQSKIIVGVLLTLVPCTTATNLVLLLFLVRTRQYRNTMSWLIMILSTSDCILGVITTPVLVVLFSKYQRTRSCMLEKASLFMAQSNSHFSAYLIFLIALNRCLNLNSDFRNHDTITSKITSRRGTNTLVVVMFFFSMVHGIIPATDIGNQFASEFMLGASNFIVYVLYFVLYARIYYKVRSSARESGAVLGCQEAGQRSATRPKYLVQLSNTVLLLLVSVGICYLPFVTIKFILAYHTHVKKIKPSSRMRFIHYISFTAAFWNSVFNALILIYRNNKIRDFVRRTHCFLRMQQYSLRISTKGGSHYAQVEDQPKIRDHSINLTDVQGTPKIPKRNLALSEGAL